MTINSGFRSYQPLSKLLIRHLKLKIPTLCLNSTAEFLAIDKAKAVLPIDGLPARIIKSDFESLKHIIKISES